jgi:hypothetical protein
MPSHLFMGLPSALQNLPFLRQILDLPIQQPPPFKPQERHTKNGVREGLSLLKGDLPSVMTFPLFSDSVG